MDTISVILILNDKEYMDLVHGKHSNGKMTHIHMERDLALRDVKIIDKNSQNTWKVRATYMLA